MKLRYLIGGVVMTAAILTLLFAPFSRAQVPNETQRISIDLSPWDGTPKQREQLQRLIDQINRAHVEQNIAIRKGLP